MKRRYSGWRFRFRGFQSEAMRRLGKSPEDGKLEFGDIVICCSIIGLLNLDILPESVPYREPIMIIATSLIVLLGMVLKFRRLSPRSCWKRALSATGALALFWSIIPWILYRAGDVDIDLQLATEISISSLFMWLVFGGCALRYRYIRRRSRQEIALMRMRQKRQRRELYL